ncbi:tetratricopeptide repeat protein [Chryseolinea sp. T2]|uniref:hybrid sensor histidine kinase/response regulator transcription factor n=1 Tax=Chryseolinea sp. T2 TaxID=3129255 RepID=UPI00307746EC
MNVLLPSSGRFNQRRLHLVASCVIVFCAVAHAQHTTHLLDSLNSTLKSASSDADKIRILKAIADESDHDKGIVYSQQALTLAEKNGNTKVIAEGLLHLGSLYTRTSNYDPALTTLRKGIDLCEANNYTSLLADSYLQLSIVYVRQQKLDSARAILNKSLALDLGKDDEVKQSFVYNMLGNVFKEENNFEEASANYIHASTIFEEYHNDEGLTQSLSNIGNIQYLLGHYDKALGYAHQCLVIAERIPKQSSIAYARRLMGRIYRKQGKFEEALKTYDAALAVYEKMGERRDVAETSTNIGNIYFELKKFDDALKYYVSALIIQRSIADSMGMAYDFSAQAMAYWNIRRPNMAVMYFDSAMLFARRKNLLSLVMDGYQYKSELYHEQKNYRLAHDNYVLYANLKDSIAALRNQEASNELEAKYQNEKKQSEINALHAENEIKTLQLDKQRTQRIYLIGVSLLSILLIGVLYNRYLIKQRTADKLKQLDTAKSRFFANISHEFRTPLTLILTPLQKLLSQPDTTIGRDELSMMHRNATRLHALINQLLDLSRIEAGKMKLQVAETDLRSTVMTLYSAFQSQADQRGIHYTVTIDEGVTKGFVDRDKLEKIVFNLISNAFKFTSDGGTISIEASYSNALTLCVRDNGIGISADHIKYVFDRFYQVDDSSTRTGEGTGIGLSLAKELAEVHHGTLTVTSETGKGSEFKLTIPVDRHQYKSEEIVTPAFGVNMDKTSSEEIGDSSELADSPEYFADGVANHDVASDDVATAGTGSSALELPLALIAEDNQDMRSFIRKILTSNYRVLEAEDGVIAWEKALSVIPDIVVTDVMMPRMDGTALCEKLKSTSATSHIPVVMLTAKAGQDSKLDGLQRGADDYLVKPFDALELQLRVHNLVEQRRKLRELYRQQITLQPQDVVVTSVDGEFLKNIMAILERRYSDPDFGVEEFNREIGLSRMQLHRKLKALTDQSTGEFIRHFRLEKACQLLVIKNAQIGQVAYDCGFTNVSHFSKCFKDHKGMTPSEFVHRSSDVLV